jgi:predicted transcriptional regulator
MPKKSPLARISITIPADLLKEADRLAAALDRSRSWVLGEGVRRWGSQSESVVPPSVIRESTAAPYDARRAGLGDQRLAQLQSDLALTPEQRVLAAEESIRVDRLLRPPCRGQRLTFFDRFEDYLEWKKHEGIVR